MGFSAKIKSFWMQHWNWSLLGSVWDAQIAGVVEQGLNFNNLHLLLLLQVLADLRAAEASLNAVRETKQSLTSANQQLDLSLQDIKAHLQEETTAKKLIEQKAKVIKSQLMETRDSKVKWQDHQRI